MRLTGWDRVGTAHYTVLPLTGQVPCAGEDALARLDRPVRLARSKAVQNRSRHPRDDIAAACKNSRTERTNKTHPIREYSIEWHGCSRAVPWHKRARCSAFRKSQPARAATAAPCMRDVRRHGCMFAVSMAVALECPESASRVSWSIPRVPTVPLEYPRVRSAAVATCSNGMQCSAFHCRIDEREPPRVVTACHAAVCCIHRFERWTDRLRCS
jgi:hypothetical protein